MQTQIRTEQATDFVLAGSYSKFLSQTFSVTREMILVIVLTVVTLFSRLWALGARVMSHDESLHVYYSWLLATGKGFAHNPMMHGPLLFDATALMNILFGASDFHAVIHRGLEHAFKWGIVSRNISDLAVAPRPQRTRTESLYPARVPSFS